MNKPFILGILLLAVSSVMACNRTNPPDSDQQKTTTKLPLPRTVEEPPTSYTDTLFIQDNFASQPFQLDSISLPAILKLFSTEQVTKKPIANRFVKDQTDTLLTIRKARSYVQLYAVSTEERKFFYKAAIIQDSLPVFSQPLQIGQTKMQVQKSIKPLAQENTLPDIIQISNNEGTDYVYLVFRNNKLTTIKFQPYLD
jgi:hypothetical protein